MKTERIIVSLTTWEKRIDNIPTVLDTIFAQTTPPDLVVLNIKEDLLIPDWVLRYLTEHQVEINIVSLEKVYKKIIPTLKKYPDDCIINIDDDWLYPSTMIEDFWTIHLKYPNNPISGNREFIKGLTCHCGCASLTKASFFDNLDLIDKDVMENCPSDDAVFTYFAARSNRPYVWTDGLYFINLEPFNPNEPYTESDLIVDAVGESWDYLVSRFGDIQPLEELLILDRMILNILQKKQEFEISKAISDGRRSVRSSSAYKTGNFLLKPFFWLSKKRGKEL